MLFRSADETLTPGVHCGETSLTESPGPTEASAAGPILTSGDSGRGDAVVQDKTPDLITQEATGASATRPILTIRDEWAITGAIHIPCSTETISASTVAALLEESLEIHRGRLGTTGIR